MGCGFSFSDLLKGRFRRRNNQERDSPVFPRRIDDEVFNYIDIPEPPVPYRAQSSFAVEYMEWTHRLECKRIFGQSPPPYPVPPGFYTYEPRVVPSNPEPVVRRTLENRIEYKPEPPQSTRPPEDAVHESTKYFLPVFYDDSDSDSDVSVEQTTTMASSDPDVSVQQTTTMASSDPDVSVEQTTTMASSDPVDIPDALRTPRNNEFLVINYPIVSVPNDLDVSDSIIGVMLSVSNSLHVTELSSSEDSELSSSEDSELSSSEDSELSNSEDSKLSSSEVSKMSCSSVSEMPASLVSEVSGSLVSEPDNTISMTNSSEVSGPNNSDVRDSNMSDLD